MNVRATQFLGVIIGVLMGKSYFIAWIRGLVIVICIFLLTHDAHVIYSDDEIPTGLELIGKALEQRKDGDNVLSTCRIFFSSLLRICIGAMFLTCLFFVVIQESNVLDIFFDVLGKDTLLISNSCYFNHLCSMQVKYSSSTYCPILTTALEFVESIDDVVFQLCKRGFFSRRLKIAANQENTIECSSTSGARRLREWTKGVIRAFYFSIMVVMCAGLSYITSKQPSGTYGCTSIVVRFGDEVWENSWVTLVDQQCSVDSDCSKTNQKCFQGFETDAKFCHEKRLLIYSHFNGLYTFDGTEAERPRYVEMNKEKGAPYKNTIPAEIIYCEDIEAWVFRHRHITTSLYSDASNECQWLLRSEQTEDFDLVELSTRFWRLWDGKIVDDYRIDIDCAECANDSDCNYMGTCVEEPGVDQKCECFPGVSSCVCLFVPLRTDSSTIHLMSMPLLMQRFGDFCQFETPCDVIRSEKDSNTTLSVVKDLDQDDDSINFVAVYGRPMYKRRMQGKPYSLMRDGYPGEKEQYFKVEYPANASAAVAPHKHNNPDNYEDDDFFEINNKSAAFQQLMKNYTFLLRYTGSRWYGQIIDPGLSANSYKEEEYHAFWMNSFSGTGQEDNSTLIISEATSGAAPVGVDFFEMRRRNKVFEGGTHDYDYSQDGIMIPLVEHDGAGFFHCNKPSE